ncbi:unnamed protein product [Chondrus crispus]|uniref:Uncharacterized protein n=1 Tax=Chondrus crispus TaxID=2769 RepID=R7QAT0_CHOCR|nr:unnamed protein product [Chondrus crispus]CDF34898.1 unnamed protein product [Chondrus crispus]|eukprot:XP_005714717.1 unnamed protein product [Chondrus crispus]
MPSHSSTPRKWNRVWTVCRSMQHGRYSNASSRMHMAQSEGLS